MKVYYFIHGWPARQEDYSKIQQRTGFPGSNFVKYVPIQWLSIGPAAATMIEQWSTLKTEFQFIVDSSSVFTRLTLKFQRKKPLVYEILMELELLVWTLAGRILKAKVSESSEIVRRLESKTV